MNEELTIPKIGECLRENQDRLKTLEDKVKFIMENSLTIMGIDKLIEFIDNGEFIVKHPPQTLQDLWDETVSKKETVKTPIKECDCICHIKDRLQGLPHFPSECECHNKPTVKEHTCSEDHYGNCYTCGKNMLTVKECEHGLSYEYSEDGCKKPTDNSEKNEHDPKVETYNCPACIKDQKIEEIISGLSKNFPGIFRYPEHLDEVESWLRDKLKDICK